MAMSHHFSQGNLALTIDRGVVIDDDDWIKQCAFLEILDKFTAYYSRWHGENKQKSVDATYNEIVDHLNKNYSDEPQIKGWYQDIFSWMNESGIFTWFDK